MTDVISHLLRPERIYSRSEVLGRPSAVPAEPGIYAWYFKEAPSRDIDLTQCWRWNEKWLLYVGISPSKPPQNGRPPSKNNLRKRIQGHMRGNASGSTLRLSLGCLLAESLGISLRRVGRTGRMSFAKNEAVLSDWLDQNAFVTWVTHPTPWVIEHEAVPKLYLPLNLDMNAHHPFYPTLKAARKAARDKARQLPVLA